MSQERIRPISDEDIGGTLNIPDGYFVYNVDLDSAIPTCTIYKKDLGSKNPQVLEIPRALAYYLTTHHNGSNKFRDLLRRDAQNTLRTKLKSLLDYSDKNIEI